MILEVLVAIEQQGTSLATWSATLDVPAPPRIGDAVDLPDEAMLEIGVTMPVVTIAEWSADFTTATVTINMEVLPEHNWQAALEAKGYSCQVDLLYEGEMAYDSFMISSKERAQIEGILKPLTSGRRAK
jgi:hypothetical protein